MTFTNSEARRPCGPDCTKWNQNVPLGAYKDLGPNICIEIGAPPNRRRAEGSLYVLETAFTVQRALCTFEGKGHPVQKATLSLRNVQTLAPIGLNSKCVKTRPKCTLDPASQDLVHAHQS